MKKMTVHGIILTDRVETNRILYEKGEQYFVRSGVDKYKVGVPLPRSYQAMFTQGGFRKVNEPLPVFSNATEMLESAGEFSLTNDGSVDFK